MPLNPEEVSSVLKKELEKFDSKLEMESVGTVLQVGDGIARIWGLEDVQMAELIQFPGDIIGMVLNLEKDNVGAAIFGSVLAAAIIAFMVSPFCDSFLNTVLPSDQPL